MFRWIAPVLVLGAWVSTSQAAVILFTNRAAFEAAGGPPTSITFQGLAPANGFMFFATPPGLTTGGVNFQGSPSNLFVIDPGFAPRPSSSTRGNTSRRTTSALRPRSP